jgi:hypothetical protein
MGYGFLTLIGSFTIWIFRGFKGKFIDIEENNSYCLYVGLVMVFIVVWLVYGVFG